METTVINNNNNSNNNNSDQKEKITMTIINNSNNNDNKEETIMKKVTIICALESLSAHKDALVMSAKNPVTAPLWMPADKVKNVSGMYALNKAYFDHANTLNPAAFDVLDGQTVYMPPMYAWGLERYLSSLKWKVRVVDNIRHAFYERLVGAYHKASSEQVKEAILRQGEHLGEGDTEKGVHLKGRSFLEVIVGTKEETKRTSAIDDVTRDWVQVNGEIYLNRVPIATVYAIVKAATAEIARKIFTVWAKDRYGAQVMVGPMRSEKVFVNDFKRINDPKVIERTQMFIEKALTNRRLEGRVFYTPAYKAEVKRRAAAKAAGSTQQQSQPQVNEQLKVEDEQLKAENEQLKAENAALKAENEQLKAENATLKAENEQLKTANAALEAEIATLIEKPDPDDDPAPEDPTPTPEPESDADDAEIEVLTADESARLLGIEEASVSSEEKTALENVADKNMPEDTVNVDIAKLQTFFTKKALITMNDAMTAIVAMAEIAVGCNFSAIVAELRATVKANVKVSELSVEDGKVLLSCSKGKFVALLNEHNDLCVAAVDDKKTENKTSENKEETVTAPVEQKETVTDLEATKKKENIMNQLALNGVKAQLNKLVPLVTNTEVARVGITEGSDPRFTDDWLMLDEFTDVTIVITKGLPTAKGRQKMLANPSKYILHATVTGMGGTKHEPNVKKFYQQLQDVRDFIQQGFPHDHVIIRVDPIMPSVNGVELAKQVVTTAHNMGFNKFRYSFTDTYQHVKVTYAKANMFDKLAGFGIDLKEADAAAKVWFDFCTYMEKNCGCTFYSCAENIAPKHHQVGCVSWLDAKICGVTKPLSGTVSKQRKTCLCDGDKIELLPHFRTPCHHNCLYCYWRTSTVDQGKANELFKTFVESLPEQFKTVKKETVTATVEQKKTVTAPVKVEQKTLESLFGKKDLNTSYDPFDPAADIARKKAAWAETVSNTETAMATLNTDAATLVGQVRRNFAGYLYDIRVKDGKVFVSGTGKAVLNGQKGWHQVIMNNGKLERVAFFNIVEGNKLFA